MLFCSSRSSSSNSTTIVFTFRSHLLLLPLFFFAFFSLSFSITNLNFTIVSATPPTLNVLIVGGAPANYVPAGIINQTTFNQISQAASYLFAQGMPAFYDWVNKINAYGGIPFHDQANTKALIKLSFINVPIDFTNLATITQSQAILTNMSMGIAQGQYGHFDVIYPLFTLSPIPFAFACDVSTTCVVVHISPPDPGTFTCQLTSPSYPLTGPPALPTDCILRNKRVGARRFDSLIGVLSNFAATVAPHLNMMFQSKISKMGIISTDFVYDLYIHDTFISQGLDLDIITVYDLVYTTSQQQLQGIWSDSFVALIVSNFQTSGVEALILIGQNPESTVMDANYLKLFHYMKQVNYAPRSIHASFTSVANPAAFDPSLTEYTFLAIPWVAQLRGTNFRAFNTSNNFDLWPSTATAASPQVFADHAVCPNTGSEIVCGIFTFYGVAMQKLVEAAGAVDAQSILNAMKSVSVTTYFGLVEFSGDNTRVVISNDQVLLQIRGNTLANFGSTTVLPVTATQSPPIFPLPIWSERAYVAGAKRYTTANEKAMIAVTVILMVFILSCSAITFYKHTSPIIKASTPMFLHYFCLGSIIMLLANFFQIPVQTKQYCQLQVWFLTLGFNLMFSALFIKTLRIYIIFNRARLSVVKITNLQLSIHLFLILSIDIIINIIWISTGNMDTEYIVADINRPVYNYETCVSSGPGQVYAYVSLCFKVILIIAGLVITYMSRNVSHDFNESTYLAACIYATAVVSALFVPIIGSSVISSRESLYLIRCIGVLFLTGSNVCIIFLPKFAMIALKMDETFGTGTGTSYQTNNTGMTNGTGLMSIQSNKVRKSSLTTPVGQKMKLGAVEGGNEVSYITESDPPRQAFSEQQVLISSPPSVTPLSSDTITSPSFSSTTIGNFTVPVTPAAIKEIEQQINMLQKQRLAMLAQSRIQAVNGTGSAAGTPGMTPQQSSRRGSNQQQHPGSSEIVMMGLHHSSHVTNTSTANNSDIQVTEFHPNAVQSNQQKR